MLSRGMLCIVIVACTPTALAQPVEGADGRLTDPAGCSARSIATAQV